MNGNSLINDYIFSLDKMEKIDYLFSLLNRPIRIAGMVKIQELQVVDLLSLMTRTVMSHYK